MKPLVIGFFIAAPRQGVNRVTEIVPQDFEVREIIANVPEDSTIDILDTSQSIFGPRPVGGGTFSTANRRLRFPEPYVCRTTTLELQINCNTQPTRPISVTVIGAAP